MTTRSCLALALVLVAGCGDDESSAPDADGGAGGLGGGGAGGGLVGGGGAGGEPIEGPIELGPTDATLTLPFDVTLSGQGSGFVGAIELSSDVGTVELGGEALAAVAYERQPFGDYVLFQTLAVDDDRWFVVWAYCDGPDLAWVYYEGTDGTLLDVEAASGTCTEGAGPVDAAVTFPAVSMPLPALLDGFTLEGPSVHLDGAAPGSLELGTLLAVLAFDSVDCTSGCGTPGWRELHTILWDRPGARACFGIFYLFDDSPTVQLSYALTLPDLSDPVGNVALEASWTYTP